MNCTMCSVARMDCCRIVGLTLPFFVEDPSMGVTSPEAVLESPVAAKEAGTEEVVLCERMR